MTNRKSRGKRKYEEKPSRTEVIPKTEGQRRYIEAIDNHDLIYCMGLAGVGKTTIAVGKACEFLLGQEKNIGRILITRPIVTSGKDIGALPGSYLEKIHPYLVPVMDEMKHYLGPDLLRKFKDEGIIEICPLEHMRGRNYHNTFMILDEAQNAEYKQIKNFITRAGHNSVLVLNGDETQTDLPDRLAGGFREVIEKTRHFDEVGFVELTELDCVRSSLVRKILTAL